MKTVKLIRLVLTNYRNIEHAALDFKGMSSFIIGENRIGKTNTLEAIYWLLTDKLLNGSSDVQAIKPISDTRKKVSVEATFDVDGKTVILKKEYEEQWVKVRGTDFIEMKGHSNTFYYNGVRQPTIKSYNQLLNADFGIDCDLGKINVMRLLIDPTYLGEIGETTDWIYLREFIINLIGDVEDDDVFEKEPTLQPIQSELAHVGGRIDQLKKYYAGIIDGSKDKIIGYEAQIEMLESTENPSDTEFEMAKRIVSDCDEKIAKLQSENGQSEMYHILISQINDKQREINALTSDLIKNNPFIEEQKKVEQDYQKEIDAISKIKTEYWAVTQKISNKEIDVSYIQVDIDKMEKEKESRLNEYRELKAKVAHPEDVIELTCPTCGRPFEDRDAIIDKFVKEWKQKMEENVTKGKELAVTIQNKKVDLDNLRKEIQELKEKLDDLFNQKQSKNAELDELSKRKNELYDSIHNYQPSDSKLTQLKDELSVLKEKEKAMIKDKENQESALNDAIAKETEKAEPYRAIIKKREYWEHQQETKQKVDNNLTIERRFLAYTEQKKELVNKFTFLKLRMLDEKVESVFGHIKFQLVKQNINGGFDTVCKPYIYNVDKDQSTEVLWKSGSKSERIVTGIAIAECIKRALDLPNLPFLFDEGGEISTDTFHTKFKTESQLICVKVQDNILKPMVLRI